MAWAIAFYCFFRGARGLAQSPWARARLAKLPLASSRRGATEAGLAGVGGTLHELQELLEAGVVPPADKWASLERLPSPWGKLAGDSLSELRRAGAQSLPTLRRLRALAEEQARAVKDARARAAQALAQAWIAAALVPLFGGAIWWLMPGVSDSTVAWSAALALAFASSLYGAHWLYRLSEEARWAGLPEDERPWLLAALCAGERFLALMRSGCPPDLAWTRACELLAEEAPGLARAWGHSIWGSDRRGSSSPAALPLVEAGYALRKAVQASLMEGRPCGDRVETALRGLRDDLRSAVDRELSLLGTRALKPLFLCVAPALLGLLAFGIYLGWSRAWVAP